MKACSFLGVCVVLLCTLGVCSGQTDKSCKDAVSDLTKRQLKRVTECTGKLKFKNGKEKNERKVCVMKCVFQEEKALDQAGYADPIGALVFVEKNLPFEVTEWSRGVMMACLDTTANLDPNELNCKTYDPLIKCAMNALGQFCNGPK